MDLVDDDETEGFCFTWTIHNFRYCLEIRGEYLESPMFEIDKLKPCKWWLFLYPRGKLSDNMAFYLRSYQSNKKKLNFALSIRSVNKSYKKIKNVECTFDSVGKGQICGFDNFLAADVVFGGSNSVYLDNGSLTVRCRIWESIVEPGYINAQTIIGIEKIIQKDLPLSNITGSMVQTVVVHSALINQLIIKLFHAEGHFPAQTIRMEIKKQNSNVNSYVTCDIIVLNKDRRNIYSVQDNNYFIDNKRDKIWTVPFLLKSNICKSGDLTWSFEIVISTGVEWSGITSRSNYGIAEYNKLRSSEQKLSPYNPTASLADILQKVYKDCKFSDFIVRTPNKEFQVHKAILCARSEVFDAMFERDMEENRTGKVEITDLDEDTVSKMLLFLYSNIVDDLEWESASKLYFAADKYGITDLKNLCSVFFKDNLDVSNVCDVLVLADMHQDQWMKSTVLEFIVDETASVITSEDWKKILKERPNLAAETMQSLLLKKL